MARIGFIGLGVMGGPMAGHLASAGHSVSVWNRTPAKAAAWAATHAGVVAADPAAAATDRDFVMLCVGDDPDVLAVYEALEPALANGCVVIDHTTCSPNLARLLHGRAQTRGADFLDAPITGGQIGAEQGQLSIMCGGGETTFAKAKTVMSAYAKRVTLIGPSGSGQLAKAVNQICVAGVLQSLAEGLAFAKTNGLNVANVIEAISGGAAQSWQMENRWETMVNDEFDFGFAVDWMRKDLRIAMAAAKASGIDLPVTREIDEFYGEIQSQGGGRWDTSSLIKRLTGPRDTSHEG